MTAFNLRMHEQHDQSDLLKRTCGLENILCVTHCGSRLGGCFYFSQSR